MNLAADHELLRDLCGTGHLLTPRQAWLHSLALAVDEAVHDDLLIGWIESDARLEFCFLVGANLPAFGDVQLIHSVRQAVGRLGRRRVSSLLWMVSISEFCFAWPSVDGQTRDAIARHSLLTGCIARQMQSASWGDSPYDAMIAGIAHNLGDLLLAAAPIKLTVVGPDDTDSPVPDAASAATEADAGRLGALLLEIWNAPAEVVACTRHFREPVRAAEQYRPLVALVRLADRLAGVLEAEPPCETVAIEALPEWHELATFPPWNGLAGLGSLTRAQLPESLLAADRLVAALGG